MRISKLAQKQLLKLPQTLATELLDMLSNYETNQRGYIKWLEGRPGYRIKINRFRVIFEFDDLADEIVILKFITNRDNTPIHA